MKKGIITYKNLKIEVFIKDIKNVYGRNLYCITPVRGSGETWVEKITLTK